MFALSPLPTSLRAAPSRCPTTSATTRPRRKRTHELCAGSDPHSPATGIDDNDAAEERPPRYTLSTHTHKRARAHARIGSEDADLRHAPLPVATHRSAPQERNTEARQAWREVAGRVDGRTTNTPRARQTTNYPRDTERRFPPLCVTSPRYRTGTGRARPNGSTALDVSE